MKHIPFVAVFLACAPVVPPIWDTPAPEHDMLDRPTAVVVVWDDTWPTLVDTLCALSVKKIADVYRVVSADRPPMWCDEVIPLKVLPDSFSTCE